MKEADETYRTSHRDGHDYDDNGRWATHRTDCAECEKRRAAGFPDRHDY